MDGETAPTCKLKGLAGATKAVSCQSDLVFVVQVLLLALQVTCAMVEKSSIPWEWCSITSPKSFKMNPTQTARIRKLSENNFQDLSWVRKLKMGSRTWSTSCGTWLCRPSVKRAKRKLTWKIHLLSQCFHNYLHCFVSHQYKQTGTSSPPASPQTRTFNLQASYQ